MPPREPYTPLTPAQASRRERLFCEQPTAAVGHLLCPECGARLKLRLSRYGRFYGCETYARTGCIGAVGANDDGSPRGIPAVKSTRNLRRKVLDTLHRVAPALPCPKSNNDAVVEGWLESCERRDRVIVRIAEVLGKPFAVGQLDAADCEKALTAMEEFGAPKSAWNMIMADDDGLDDLPADAWAPLSDPDPW